MTVYCKSIYINNFIVESGLALTSRLWTTLIQKTLGDNDTGGVKCSFLTHGSTLDPCSVFAVSLQQNMRRCHRNRCSQRNTTGVDDLQIRVNTSDPFGSRPSLRTPNTPEQPDLGLWALRRLCRQAGQTEEALAAWQRRDSEQSFASPRSKNTRLEVKAERIHEHQRQTLLAGMKVKASLALFLGHKHEAVDNPCS